MKLGIIFNVWDCCELLEPSINSIYDHADLIILVYQEVSNFGEQYSPLPAIEHLQGDKIILVKFDPDQNFGAMQNERVKRNVGIEFAKANHCTHFLHMDCDEFYDNFEDCKKLYIQSGHAGSVCRLQTYFRKPIFRFDRPEDYFVTFIHRLQDDTHTGNSTYRFYVDPTRTVNETDVVELPIFMHHFSWCRKDIMRKVRNSSANMTDMRVLRNKKLMDDYDSPNLGEGYHLENFNRKIMVVSDSFNLSPIFE